MVRGLGRPQTKTGRKIRAYAVRLVMDDLAMFDRREIPALIREAEKTFAHDWRTQDDARRYAIRAIK